MGAGARAKIPDNSAMQSEIVFIPNQLAASATRHLGATSLAGLVASDELAVAAADQFNPNVGGRNVVLTQVEGAGATLTSVWDVYGYDQFGNEIVERSGTISSSAAWTGSKIFQRVTKVKCVSIANNVGGDTLAIGDGNKVGIPRMFQANLEEIIGASLIIAAGTTVTAKTINTTNFDTTYFALKAAFFAASAVVDGDSVAIAYKGTSRTPDEVNRFPARS